MYPTQREYLRLRRKEQMKRDILMFVIGIAIGLLVCVFI